MAWGITPFFRAGRGRIRPLPRQIFKRIAVPVIGKGKPCGKPKKLLLCHWRTRTFLIFRTFLTRFVANRSETAFC